MDISTHQTRPYRIGFVLIDGYALLSYAAAMEPLRAANLLAGKTLYHWENLAVQSAQSRSSAGVLVRADAAAGERTDFDLVLVIAGGVADMQLPQPTISWLQLLDRRGVIIGGISGGPLLLARAGLMGGELLTSHREHAHLLVTLAPRVSYTEARFLISDTRVSCAGGTAALDLMQAIIQRHHGSALAADVGDWFLHRGWLSEPDDQDASRQRRGLLLGKALGLALQAMEMHLADPLTLSQLADIAGVGQRQLNRLFNQHFQRSCQAHYRAVRLDAASTLLVSGQLSIADIARATGFTSASHFSHCFRRNKGYSPRLFRQRAQARPADASAAKSNSA